MYFSSGAFGDHALGVVAGSGFDDLIAELAQNTHRNVTHANVVLEHEYCFGAGRKFFQAGFFVRRRGWGRNFRQINPGSGAFSFFAVDDNMAAALVYDAITRSQTEPAMIVLGCEERLEQTRFGFVVHSAAGIDNADDDVRARNTLAAQKWWMILGRQIDNRCFHCKPAAFWHGIARVDREVENDLSDLAGIDPDVNAFLLVMQMARNRNIFAEQSEQRSLEIRDERIDFDDLRFERPFAAERQQMPGQIGGAAGGFANLGEMA